MPNECVDLLRERDIPTLAGNHDHAAVDLTDVSFFNEIAKRAVFWTRDRLSPENVEWLKARPFTLQWSPDYFFVHASPREPEAWNYVLTFGEARACFDIFAERICCIGHSHQPAIVAMKGEDLFCPEGCELRLEDEHRYLVNVGSVGQPRDRNPAACFVIIDLDEPTIRFVRVSYEIEAAKQTIVQANLPPELAERLSYGW
jgi:diadenosine tetraphosphatase ApaH/serine/threonine PP2A family protein phosphatase